INSGHQDGRAYIGLGRVRWAISMHKSGWSMIDKAHQLDPTDPEIQKLWVRKLSRAERIKYLEEYLAGESNDDAETRANMQHYLELSVTVNGEKSKLLLQTGAPRTQLKRTL